MTIYTTCAVIAAVAYLAGVMHGRYVRDCEIGEEEE